VRWRIAIHGSAIREQQNHRGGRDQEQPERETLESISHGKDDCVSADLVLPYGRVSTAARRLGAPTASGVRG
jgi:hypothetical protein